MTHIKSAETVEVTAQMFLHAGYELFFYNARNTADPCNVLADNEIGGVLCPVMLSH